MYTHFFEIFITKQFFTIWFIFYLLNKNKFKFLVIYILTWFVEKLLFFINIISQFKKNWFYILFFKNGLMTKDISYIILKRIIFNFHYLRKILFELFCLHSIISDNKDSDRLLTYFNWKKKMSVKNLKMWWKNGGKKVKVKRETFLEIFGNGLLRELL